MFKHLETGKTGNYNDFWYTLDEGPHKGGEVNAIDLGEAMEITKYQDGSILINKKGIGYLIEFKNGLYIALENETVLDAFLTEQQAIDFIRGINK